MKYVIIGASAAGMTAAKTLAEQDPGAEIKVISQDQHVHSRCMLHKYLSGEREAAGLNFTPESFFEDRGIRWEKGVSVKAVKTEEKEVVLEDESRVPYDKLLIAAGANSFLPPVGDLRKAKNVFGLRHLTDAQSIVAAAETANRVLIVGSGLVGLDAAYGLLERGKDVAVVEMAPQILPVQLDAHAAMEYQRRFEEAGCRFLLGRKAAEAACGQDGLIHQVALDDGQVIPCDLIIVAAGVRPATGFLEGSGISCEKGIAVNQWMETSAQDVYAAGDVTGLSGIWPNAMKQGWTAALNMCGVKTPYEDRYGVKNTINFFGLVTLCIGRIKAEDGDSVLIREDRNNYKRLLVRESRVEGVLLQGDISGAGIWQYLIKNQINIGSVKKDPFHLTFADFYGTGKNGAYEWAVPAAAAR